MINNNIAIILVAPQMGENIGASARAMKNFGFSDLRIITPRDGWPNAKAESMSVGAIDIIKKAKVFLSIEEAVGDLSFVYATTGSTRAINKSYILSKHLDQEVSYNGSIGIMFGRENCGLTNQELSYANKVLIIDTDKKFSSLNISHAVSVICYELFKTRQQNNNNLKNDYKLASQAELNYFYEHLFSKLEEKGFFRVPEKKEHMTQKIRNLFSRIDKISQAELQTLRGIVTVLTSNKWLIMNYFELFSIEQKYGIDQQLLQKQYFALQAKYHPDRSKTELERHKNLEYSMLINESFKILQDDYLRAEYLLKLKGEFIDDNNLKNLLSPNQLEEILESYELIETTQDLSQLDKMQQEKTKYCKHLVLKLEQAFEKNNLKQALDLTISLKYLTNLVRNIKLKIKNANN